MAATTNFSASQIQALRDLPVDEVRKALLKVQSLRRATRPVKNGVDVAVYEGGLTFQASLEKLAKLFPDALHTGQRTGIGSFADVMQDAIRVARHRGKTFPALSPQGMRTAKDLVAWWKALQLRSIDINPGIPQKVKEKCEKTRTFTDSRGRVMSGVYVNTNFKDVDLFEAIRAIPMLLAISAQGETETAPVGIFCTPHWPPSHVGVVMDDIFNPDFMQENPDLLKKFPPSAVVATSDRFPQAFWILKKKYPEPAFYDAFVVHLNTVYHGDPKIRKMGWNTRVAGFMNQKHFCQDGSGKTPFVHVKEATSRYPIEMEHYMDAFHEQWLREQAETAATLGGIAVPAPTAQAEPAREKAAQPAAPVKPVREKPVTSASSQNPLPQNLIRGTITFDEMVARLREVPVPDWVTELGLKFQAYFAGREERNARDKRVFTRSQTDYEVSMLLDECGAYPDEIYSFLLKHAIQDDEPVKRTHSDGTEFVAVRVSGEKAFDRKCRRDVCNASLFPRDSYRARHPEREKDVWHIYDRIMPRSDHKEVVARLEAYDEAERQYMERKQAQAAPAMAM